MSRSQTKSTQILSGVRAKESTSLQTTQSYIEAHRYITPRSTRAFTEPSHNIDSNLMGIINDKAPNRMEKLLRKKGIPSPSQRQRKSAKCHQQIFDRAYFRERERIITEVENGAQRKQQLRQKLGMCPKPNISFYKIDKSNLTYFETKFGQFSKQGRYKQRLHPVCMLYEQYEQRASRNPASMQNPFSNDHY